MARTRILKEYMVRWIAAIHESKKRKALRKTLRVVEIANGKKVPIKKTKAAKSKETTVLKRNGQSLNTEEKEAKKAKVDACEADEEMEDVFSE